MAWHYTKFGVHRFEKAVFVSRCMCVLCQGSATPLGYATQRTIRVGGDRTEVLFLAASTAGTDLCNECGCKSCPVLAVGHPLLQMGSRCPKFDSQSLILDRQRISFTGSTGDANLQQWGQQYPCQKMTTFPLYKTLLGLSPFSCTVCPLDCSGRNFILVLPFTVLFLLGKYGHDRNFPAVVLCQNATLAPPPDQKH